MNPINSSFGELELLRFMFEMNQQPVDSFRLQQVIHDHQMRSRIEYSSVTPPPDASPTANGFKPQRVNTSTPSTSVVTQIPEPKVVFNYAPTIPTPAATPEPAETPKQETTDTRPRLMPIDTITEWCGASLYHNLPDVAMVEYDKMLRESHVVKAEVIKLLHADSPINYDYNPNKSRIRTNYENPSIAEGRTKNNIASRRSRQRKKFFQHVMQYSVEYDEDENFLLAKQETWLRGIIDNLERKIVAKESEEGEENIARLRKQCGFM